MPKVVPCTYARTFEYRTSMNIRDVNFPITKSIIVITAWRDVNIGFNNVRLFVRAFAFKRRRQERGRKVMFSAHRETLITSFFYV